MIRHILKQSLLCAFGTLVVLALLQPFGIDQIGEKRLLFILGEAVLTFLAMLLSQGILQLIPAYRRFQPTGMWQAFLKGLPIYILITPILSAALLSYNFWFRDQPISWAWHTPDGSISLHGFGMMSGWVFIIGLFILVWDMYRYKTNSLEQELQEIRAINALLEKQQERAGESSMEDATICHLEGSGQNDKLSLSPTDLIYIESMANYADIVYMGEGMIRHKTLRITLKQLREQLGDTALVQCHRAFLVNMRYVQNLSVRSAGTYEIELFGMDKRIPVSRTNVTSIRQLLS